MKTRSLFVSLILVVIGGSTTSAGAASITAGGTCKVSGKIAVSGGSTFVCAKVGAKKVWIEAGSSQSNKSTPTTKAKANDCAGYKGQRFAPTYGATPENMLIIGFNNTTSCTLQINIRGTFIGSSQGVNMQCPVNAAWTLAPNEYMKMDFAGYTGLTFRNVFPQLSNCGNVSNPMRDFSAVVTGAS